MSDDETPEDLPTEESIYEAPSPADLAVVFKRGANFLEYICDALRLIFKEIAKGHELGYSFALADMDSDDTLVLTAEWQHSPELRILTLVAPERDAYVFGTKTYDREHLTSILEAAITALSAAEVNDDSSLPNIAGKVRFEACREDEAPGVQPTPEPDPVGEVSPATAQIVPAKKPPLPWLRWLALTVIGFFAFSILSVAIHRYVPVPITFLMIERLVQGNGLDHRWVGASKISDNLKAAVIASEDEKFCSHNGFDVEAIEKAQKYNATHKKKRGASTISQQTAKNVFLWPDRSWVRKGFEVWYTFLIEHMWPKDRIMTVYLNSVEWAPGVYGAEAASQHWFHHSAATLSKAEAAKLAAILPSPLKYKTTGRYVVRQSGTIQARARAVDNDGLDACAAD